MTETTRRCIDCDKPTQYPEGRCLDCYRDWLETPEGSADKLLVEKRTRLMALWAGKSGPSADLAQAIFALTSTVETGDTAAFAGVAKEVLYVLNLAGQGLGLPDTEIAPLLRAAVTVSSSLSRAVDLAEASAGGHWPESWSRPHPRLRGGPVSGGVAGVDVTADQGRMAPSWDNGVARLYHADARSIPLPDESVHCVVTSPPYWNLRDYGLSPSVWGGDSECPHYWLDGVVAPGARSSDSKSGSKQLNANRRDGMPSSAFCGECGAWLGALGLEPTVNLYVAHIVEIFREVWRVLRKDGTCWINLGDSYSGRRCTGI